MVSHLLEIVTSALTLFAMDHLKILTGFDFSPHNQSMVAFLKDPSGPPLWEENPEAKDVVHVETEKVRGLSDDGMM